MLEPGQPLNYAVLVPTSQTVTVQSLLSLRQGGNYFDGYDVRQISANCIQVTRRYTPQWAVVVAIAGSFFFLLGLVVLLVRETETLTINVYQRGEGSHLSVCGRSAPSVAASLNLVIGRLASGVTMTPAAAAMPAASAGPFSGLDPSGRELLLRAQRSREAVLASKVYAEDLLEHAAGEMALRHHEQEITVLLHDIARLRAQLPFGQSTGPMTSAVLDPQQRILTQARVSAESRVQAMERYAAEVSAADAARLDWENAVRLSGLNERFLDLAARTAADEHAIGELKDLTGQAAVAAEAFRQSLRQASMAAEALALPPQ